MALQPRGKAQPLSPFLTFKALALRCHKIFQRCALVKHLCIAYYSAALEDGEHITDFYMRFHSLMQRLPTTPPTDNQIDTFTWGVRSPLPAHLLQLDFSHATLEDGFGQHRTWPTREAWTRRHPTLPPSENSSAPTATQPKASAS